MARIGRMHDGDDSPPAWLRHSGDETHLLREIMRAQRSLVGAFSRETGLPGARLALVRLLGLAGPSGAGVMDLARHLGVNAAAVTRQVAVLEKEGLVSRKSDLRDKRRSALCLTRKGRRLFDEAHARSHAFEKALVAKLSKQDLAAALRVLALVRKSIEETTKERFF